MKVMNVNNHKQGREKGFGDRESRDGGKGERESRAGKGERTAIGTTSKGESGVGMIVLKGSTMFRHRIVCALLTHRSVRIDEIRAQAPGGGPIGLTNAEVAFLQLMERISNGTRVDINPSGTQVVFRPGVLVGGEVQMTLPPERGLGYYLEPLLALAPFGKTALHARLDGVTNHPEDLSVDVLRTAALPLMRRFGIEDGVEFTVVRRGQMPLGGGQVLLRCPVVRALTPVQWTDAGKIAKIRGLVHSSRVAPTVGSRVVDAAKGELLPYVPNVYLYLDHYKGAEAGLSPGFGCMLVAESTTGALLSAEALSSPGALPEDVGLEAARALLDEVLKGGVVDSALQPMLLLLMVLCPEDVSQVRVGMLRPHTVRFLRLLDTFFGVRFRMEPDPDSMTILMSCLGVGYSNVARKMN